MRTWNIRSALSIQHHRLWWNNVPRIAYLTGPLNTRLTATGTLLRQVQLAHLCISGFRRGSVSFNDVRWMSKGVDGLTLGCRNQHETRSKRLKNFGCTVELDWNRSKSHGSTKTNNWCAIQHEMDPEESQKQDVRRDQRRVKWKPWMCWLVWCVHAAHIF